MAKVSVIIPVYNVRDYIKKCVDSVVNQTLKDIEIIIVNDGTLDDSMEIINNNYNDKRIKIFNKKNTGLADTRNFAISKAKGDYLFFLDSDDYIELNALEEMYNEAISKKCDVVIGDYYKAYSDGHLERMDMISHYHKDDIKSIATAMPTSSSKLIKREIFLKYNLKFLVGRYFEDNAMMPFALSVCENISYIKKPYYYYFQRDGSILKKKKYDPKWMDIFVSLETLIDKYREYNLEKKYHDELEYIYIEYLLHASNLKFIDYKEAYPNIKLVHDEIKKRYPKWRKNKYYKEENLKYKVMCNLFYYNQLWLIKALKRK